MFKKKIILVDHYSYALKNYKDYFIGILIKIFNHKVIVLNKDNYKYYSKEIKINHKNIQIIKNGIDLKKINLKTNYNKIFKIGTASRINSQKYISLVIETINSKELKNFNIEYSIAGVGEDLERLKKLTMDLKIQNKVKFIGFLSEKKLNEWYKNLDLYIQPSKGEASSTSILQAMSLSIIVLGSRVLGIKEMINERKKTGFLFSNNQKSLSSKIKFIIMLNKSRKVQILKNQIRYLAKEHDINNIFEQYKKLLLKN